MYWWLFGCALVVAISVLAERTSAAYLRRARRNHERARADFRFWSVIRDGLRD